MTRETFLLIILLIFSGMIVIMLATFGVVVWKAVFVTRYLKSMRTLTESQHLLMNEVSSQLRSSEALLGVIKSYLALVHAERRTVKEAVKETISEKSQEMQDKVEVKAEEIKQEIRTTFTGPDPQG